MEKLAPQILIALDDNHYRNHNWMEESPAEVLVHSAEIPHGYVVPLHSHRRTQILCVFRGVVLVATALGRWMIPPGHALLIPSGLEHSVEMFSDVSMRSLYVLPRHGKTATRMLSVLEVTDLARSLLLEALILRDQPERRSKAELVMALLLEEIETLPERALGLPFPTHARLAELCRDYVIHPAPDARIDDWAARLAMSRRTFTRLFREQTGISFATWRQQACVFACLPKLADGQPITRLALEAGYESVPAFTTMFKRMLGTSPRSYFLRQ